MTVEDIKPAILKFGEVKTISGNQNLFIVNLPLGTTDYDLLETMEHIGVTYWKVPFSKQQHLRMPICYVTFPKIESDVKMEVKYGGYNTHLINLNEKGV